MVATNNPYLTPVARVVAAPLQRPHGGSQSNMGPQSQRRISLLDRTHQLQAQSHKNSSSNNNNKRKKGAQQTLFGAVAFDPLKNCPKCRGGKSSHKGHHEKCWNNPRRGQSKAYVQEEKRLKMLFETPLTEAEKCSGQHMTREATDAFFAPREHVVEVAAVPATTTTTSLPHPKQSTTNAVAADELHGGVTAAMNDPIFVESHKSSTAPLAMLAFAKVVMKSIVHDKQINTLSHFDGMSIAVP